MSVWFGMCHRKQALKVLSKVAGEMIVGPAKTLFLDEISTGQLPVQLRACVVCRCPVKNVSIFINFKLMARVQGAENVSDHAGLDSSTTYLIVKCIRNFTKALEVGQACACALLT